jgi:Raf kinase inhibitor-like YbhB/YbcL family protein
MKIDPSCYIELNSTAFHNGEVIPRRYTGDGQNVSPPFKWLDPPAGTQTFALLCEDPDAPRGIFCHWVLFNLPVESRELAEGQPHTLALPNGTVEGTNDFGDIGYGGPAPPAGKVHHYHFRLFALDTTLTLPPGATRKQLLAAIAGHILAEGLFIGTYRR